MTSLLSSCTASVSMTTEREAHGGTPDPVETVQRGTVTGRLLMVGGPAGTEPRAVGGSITAVATSPLDASQSFDVAVDEDGDFRVSLPVATYSVFGRSPLFNSSSIPCFAAGPLLVGPVQSVHVDVLCHRK